MNYLQPARTLLQHLTEHRDMNNAYLSGDVLFLERITAKQRQLAEDLQAMDTVDAQSGHLLNSTASWRAIKADWQSLSADVAHLTAQNSFARHTALIEKLLDLNVQVGITSNLVLDPDSDSYYLMDIVVNRLPFLVEHLGQLQGIATDIVARRQIAADDLLRLSKRLGQLEMMEKGVESSLALAFQSNGSLQTRLGAQPAAFTESVGAFLTVLEPLAHGGESVDATRSPTRIFGAGTQAIEASLGLYDATAPALLDLLQRRIAGLNEKKFTTLSIVLVAVGFALLLAYGIARIINRSLQQAQQVASAIAVGNLNQVIPLTSRDEVGQLLGALATTQQQLRQVVVEINSTAATVNSAAGEIAQGSGDLAQRTEEQASALEETASSMEELTSTVQYNADHSGQANQLADAAQQQAEQGGQAVDQAITAMTAIHQSSKRIADIIGVIDEIAFQTNLLALNAAVEAARAGEQGRGFAVVAGEVRKLAQRSADAAKQIKILITDSVAKVADGGRLVEQSGHTLKEIVIAIKKVSAIVAEMAAASREQALGIEQVNKAILQMDQTTQQNAALVEQTASASGAMSEQAAHLQTLIGFFKLVEIDHSPDTGLTNDACCSAGVPTNPAVGTA